MTKKRVLVVEDCLTVRRFLVAALNATKEFEVVGEASTANQAVDLCQQLRPSVVTMDMALGATSGVAAIRRIMAERPVPILIVSASLNRDETYSTYEALAAGAIDVLEKPCTGSMDHDWRVELEHRLRVVSKVRPVGRSGRPRLAAPHAAPTRVTSDSEPRLVVIGASTGGPNALLTLFSGLPADYPLPIIFVLHIEESFGPTFAEWLNAQVPLPVRLVSDGDRLPEPGEPGAVMAVPGSHLVVCGSRLRLTKDPEIHSCRPSVDALFLSAAEELGASVVGCLLTGMGRDGALGLKAIRDAGGLTIAQDEESSVVFGMPDAAIRLDAAQSIMNVADMPDVLGKLAVGAHAGRGVS